MSPNDTDKHNNSNERSGAAPSVQVNKNADEPLPLSSVLEEELEAVHDQKLTFDDWYKEREREVDRTTRRKDGARDETLYAKKIEELKRRNVIYNIHKFNKKAGEGSRAALCLSGGGIRSASFCLGVIQGLADRGILKKFHYLSTVSGGGYIGSWLSAWMIRDGVDDVHKRIAKFKDRKILDPEQGPIKHIRNFGNFLIPRVGFFSADMFAAVSVTLRNIVINWLTLLPIIMGVLLIPHIVTKVIDYEARANLGWWGFVLLGASAFFGIVALTAILLKMPSRRGSGKPVNQARFLAYFQLPVTLGIICWMAYEVATFTTTGVEWNKSSFFRDHRLLVYIVFGAAVCAVPVIISMIRNIGKGGAGAWVIVRDGLPIMITAGLIGLTSFVAMRLVPLDPRVQNIYIPGFFKIPVSISLDARLFVCLYPTFMAVGCWLASTAFVLINEFVASSNSIVIDREWWGRGGGWMVAIAFCWTVGSGLSLYHNELFGYLGAWGSAAVVSAGGAAGAASAVLGYCSFTGSGEEAKTKSKSKSKLPKYIHPTLTFIAIIVLIAALAFASERLTFVVGRRLGLDASDFGGNVILFIVSTLSLILFSILMSLATGVNRYSLHSVYGNRLCRAFLGASNDGRDPDPFTNFDDRDNIQFSELWPDRNSDTNKRDAKTRPPFHIINVALNNGDVSDKRLAWQQRKAQSFTMSPLHCGSPWLHYQTTKNYGGSCGMSLSKAMTISGAAASPNMGYHSSPTVTFLMSLFNVRLGWWLANPGAAGEKAWKRSEPKLPIITLLNETFGKTSDESKYVYLSDGGHFENLALYEMVLRRCKYIVVADAGADPKREFEDLGNAIRKIRVDLGINIHFTEAKFGAPEEGDFDLRSTRCLIGEIDYKASDCELCKSGGKCAGCPDVENGIIIYLKPTIRGDETPEVLNYWKQFPDFPHQSTGDQFFDEPQFESYRRLGRITLEDIFKDRGLKSKPERTWSELLEIVKKFT